MQVSPGSWWVFNCSQGYQTIKIGDTIQSRDCVSVCKRTCLLACFLYVWVSHGDRVVHKALSLAQWQNEVACCRMTWSLRQLLFTVSMKKSAWMMVMPLAVKPWPALNYTQKHRGEREHKGPKNSGNVTHEHQGSHWESPYFLTVLKSHALFEEFNFAQEVTFLIFSTHWLSLHQCSKLVD